MQLCGNSKKANFRSAPQIVELLNKLRPDLKQISAIGDCACETIVVHCNDYSGIRRTDRGFKDDLPASELRSRLENLSDIIIKHYTTQELKKLMITHKVLANQQGYDSSFSILTTASL